ncbi:hypothetical protein HOD83_01845 [Candidatus Woesearchaeota archaeon]|jgi:hypothetical protein|nr:hypothetical protein [Candidatus Woesearchaeota archaeon]MBT4114109.1 hypothetical protein [Candidatus Woesearchaeota archaeon]MBT4248308.1 hypothetical protein [Candidatus Woesearchaeota archaeon]
MAPTEAEVYTSIDEMKQSLAIVDERTQSILQARNKISSSVRGTSEPDPMYVIIDQHLQTCQNLLGLRAILYTGVISKAERAIEAETFNPDTFDIEAILEATKQQFGYTDPEMPAKQK